MRLFGDFAAAVLMLWVVLFLITTIAAMVKFLVWCL